MNTDNDVMDAIRYQMQGASKYHGLPIPEPLTPTQELCDLVYEINGIEKPIPEVPTEENYIAAWMTKNYQDLFVNGNTLYDKLVTRMK